MSAHEYLPPVERVKRPSRTGAVHVFQPVGVGTEAGVVADLGLVHGLVFGGLPRADGILVILFLLPIYWRV